MKRLLWVFGFFLTTQSLGAANGYYGIWDGVIAGYRHDAFNWNIAGFNGSPNVRAEIKTENIHTVQIGSKLTLAGWDTIYIRGEGFWGWILQQDATYKLFDSDNRQDLVLEEMFCRGGDQIFGGKGGIGFHLFPCGSKFDLAFLVGYNFEQVRFRGRNPKLTFHNTVELGSIEDLLYRYQPKFNGGFAGADMYWRYRDCLFLFLSYELHFTTYRAKGFWTWEEPIEQLASDEVQELYQLRWKDCSEGWGHVFTATFTYNTSYNWYLGVFASARFWKIRKGEYGPVYIRDEAQGFRGYTVRLPTDTSDLNPMDWTTYFVGINLQTQF